MGCPTWKDIGDLIKCAVGLYIMSAVLLVLVCVVIMCFQGLVPRELIFMFIYITCNRPAATTICFTWLCISGFSAN